MKFCFEHHDSVWLKKKNISSETQGGNHIPFRDDCILCEESGVLIRHLLKLTFHRRESFCKLYYFCTLKERHYSERSEIGPDGMLHFTNTIIDCRKLEKNELITAFITKHSGGYYRTMDFIVVHIVTEVE